MRSGDFIPYPHHSSPATGTTPPAREDSQPAHPEAPVPANAERSRRLRRTSTTRRCARSTRQSTESPIISASLRRHAGFLHDGLHAQRIGLLGRKAVAAVYSARRSPPVPAPRTISREGLTGLFESTAIRRGTPLGGTAFGCTASGGNVFDALRGIRQARQHLRNPLINRGVVELVLPVVAEKILQSRSEVVSRRRCRRARGGQAWARHRPHSWQ
jgi:hypothetical protein